MYHQIVKAHLSILVMLRTEVSFCKLRQDRLSANNLKDKMAFASKTSTRYRTNHQQCIQSDHKPQLYLWTVKINLPHDKPVTFCMGFPDTIENHGCCNEFNKVILEGAKQNKAKNDLRRHHHGSGNETWAKGIGRGCQNDASQKVRDGFDNIHFALILSHFCSCNKMVCIFWIFRLERVVFTLFCHTLQHLQVAKTSLLWHRDSSIWKCMRHGSHWFIYRSAYLGGVAYILGASPLYFYDQPSSNPWPSFIKSQQ